MLMNENEGERRREMPEKEKYMVPSKRFFLWLTFLVTVSFLGCGVDNNVTPREGGISGTAVDKSAKPLEGVLVSWAGDRGKYGKSDATGTFIVDNVNFGDQVFLAEKAGYRTLSFTVPVYSGAITQLKKVVLETASFDFREIKIEKVSATHAVISWKTTEFTNGVLEFGETEAFGRTVRETTGVYATLHTLTISDLKSEKRYFFRIIASRENRPSETSAVYDFQTVPTLEDTTPPAAPNGLGIALTEYANQVTLFWAPNTETDLKGYKLYRSELPSSGFAALGNIVVTKGTERYIDVGVVTGKKYYYRVAALDQANNEGSASDIVSMVIPGDLSREVVWTRANSPYLLAGDLDIANTGVLRIDPGVEVRIADYDGIRRGDTQKVEIRVKGAIIANAANDVPIVFTSSRATPAAGDWGGISFISAVEGGSKLDNVLLAYAGTGLKLSATKSTFQSLEIKHCQVGVAASQSSQLTLATFTIRNCDDGMLIRNNTAPIVQGALFSNCKRGLTSSGNDGATFRLNDFLEFTDYGLTMSDTTGTLLVEDNLFVSTVGLGLHIVDYTPRVWYNTFDTPLGIRIDRTNPIVEKNILVTTKSVTGQGFKGIEHLGGVSPLPTFGPNDLFGFPVGKDYVGCASTAGSLGSQPLFMRDLGGSTYDYRLRQAFPATNDVWGIRRQSAPRE